VTAEEELALSLDKLEVLLNRAKILLQERHYMELCNVLNKMQRVSLEGTYWILDIADLAG